MTEDDHPSNHPPLPPTAEDDRFSRLRLLRSHKVGISSFYRLLQTYGSAQAALEALPDRMRGAGISEYKPCPPGAIEAELDAGQRAGAKLVFRGTATYPQALENLTDAPPALWIMGESTLLQRPTLALVGARNASSLGIRMAKALAHELGQAGFAIVSGLARGIDTAAHWAALKTGTIAVQAGGVDVVYPAENAQLAQEISDQGLRLSEEPMGLQPMTRHFPKRNRLISGLAQAVVVVEAAGKSGSLITARMALDQGREVMAVPGHPFDARAGGCNLLIREGAVLVRSGADVIEALQGLFPSAPPQKRAPRPMPPLVERTPVAAHDLQSEILTRLSPAPLAEDQLIRDLATPVNKISPILLDLELDGKITRHPGGLVSLAPKP